MSDTYHLTVLGSGGAGKSALVVQFVHRHYCEIYDPTIEDVYRRQWQVDGKVAVADILDTAGQDEYISLRSSWYAGADGFLLVYNMCNRESFDNCQELCSDVLRFVDGTPTPFVVVATHSDLGDQRVVSELEGYEFATRCGPQSEYIEVSNRLRRNVDEAFTQVVRLSRDIKKQDVKRRSDLRKKCVLL